MQSSGAMHVSFLVAETLLAILCTCKFSSATIDIRERGNTSQGTSQDFRCTAGLSRGFTEPRGAESSCCHLDGMSDKVIHSHSICRMCNSFPLGHRSTMIVARFRNQKKSKQKPNCTIQTPKYTNSEPKKHKRSKPRHPLWPLWMLNAAVKGTVGLFWFPVLTSWFPKNPRFQESLFCVSEESVLVSEQFFWPSRTCCKPLTSRAAFRAFGKSRWTNVIDFRESDRKWWLSPYCTVNLILASHYHHSYNIYTLWSFMYQFFVLFCLVLSNAAFCASRTLCRGSWACRCQLLAAGDFKIPCLERDQNGPDDSRGDTFIFCNVIDFDWQWLRLDFWKDFAVCSPLDEAT